MNTCRHACTVAGALLLALAGCAPPTEDAKADTRWWKGNLHTHSLWSDGDDYPEMIVDWYRENGYHFVALSDHNTVAEGEKWVQPSQMPGGRAALQDYLDRFEGDWVQRRVEGTDTLVRLKTLDEFRPLFEQEGRFLIIKSEEITDRFEDKPVHVNATNLQDLIEPQGGSSVREVMQNNVDAVLAQRDRTGRPMFPHINHPNFGWAVTAEDLMALQGERFFEVYNGHPLVHNEGDSLRPSTERMWDIILAERLVRGGEVYYGIAVDDAHHYHGEASNRANPGRGWVMVRTSRLSASAIVQAMEAGDFYASTGVTLDSVRYDGATLALSIRPDTLVTYVTRFIGTRREYEPARDTLARADTTAAVTRRYGDDVGIVLAEVEGVTPAYTFAGDELYVRAKVISSKLKPNPYRAGEREVAWTQPVVPGVQGARPDH